ncbi:MAG TPA: ATP-dependent DNA ligase, partial [Acidimicrobiales bacterium]
MDLPIAPPVKPMLAKAVYEVPRQPGLLFEPKWDGFRCIVFRDGDEMVLGSRNDRPLTRYFPEVAGALRAALPRRCVVDGEIVVVGADGLDFEALQQRIHPATSRINRLAEETPASFVAFDLLALGDRDLCDQPFAERRRLLEDSVPPTGHPNVHVTPITDDADVAEDWFHRFEGAGFDGVMAKPRDAPYVQDARTMLKVKHQRTADAVVAGFRWHKDGAGIGSLLLGLYDDEGTLHHVGVATSFTEARRRSLVDEIAPLRERALEGHPWRG